MTKPTHISLFIFLCLLPLRGYSVEWSTASLTVQGIEANRGGDITVYVFLEDGFPVNHEKALRSFSAAATEATLQIDIQVPDTPFAIKVHHDEDLSGTVTKNWTGFIPAEGLGFSSGARLGFGPPAFKDAAMTRPEDGRVDIRVMY